MDVNDCDSDAMPGKTDCDMVANSSCSTCHKRNFILPVPSRSFPIVQDQR